MSKHRGYSSEQVRQNLLRVVSQGVETDKRVNKWMYIRWYKCYERKQEKHGNNKNFWINGDWEYALLSRVWKKCISIDHC